MLLEDPFHETSKGAFGLVPFAFAPEQETQQIQDMAVHPLSISADQQSVGCGFAVLLDDLVRGP